MGLNSGVDEKNDKSFDHKIQAWVIKMALHRSPDYQTSFESTGLSVQEKVQYRFSRWQPKGPAWISNQNFSTSFNLQVTSILPVKFQVNWPFS